MKIFLAAFSEKFSDGMTNGAELQALINGLCLYQELDFVNVYIESDSTLVVGWVVSKLCSVWYL